MDMQKNEIVETPVTLEISSGLLSGEPVINSVKRIADLENVFSDEQARLQMAQDKMVYEVQAWLPEEDGTPGGLYFGTTIIYPGKVGEEYFMTRGHFHAKIDTGEYYWGIKGEGVLILMDTSRNVYAEHMKAGSLHYINRSVAHRVANVGNEPLIFNACWPSDAGHNYEEINKNGFASRIFDKGGTPTLIPINEI